MRYLIEQILPHLNYTFIVGTPHIPDIEFKKWVET